MKKKLGIWAIAITLFISICGCGRGKGGENVQQTALAKDYVYSVETLELEEWKDGTYSNALKSGERMYVYGYEWNEEDVTVRFAPLNADGSLGQESEIPMGTGGMNGMLCDDQGFLYGVKVLYDEAEDEDAASQDKYYFFKMNDSGEELFNIFLNEVPEVAQASQEGWFYVGNPVLIGDTITMRIVDQYFQFDKEGNFLRIFKGQEEKPLSDVTLIPLNNGKLACTSYEEDGCHVGYVDSDTGAVSQLAKIPGNSYDYSVYAGIGYDLYLVNTNGIFGYNIGSENVTQLMNYVDSDLGVYEIYNLLPINEREFWGLYEDMEQERTCLGRFAKVDPKDVKDRQTIVLACTGINWDMRTNVVKFNKSNEKYRITIQDYTSLYASDTDYQAGLNRLNADIVSGKTPDLLILDSYMPVSSYIAKGLFEDLKPYIENDPELEIDDYMPNILEAFSVDGKLYQLVPRYTISTVLAKTSDVGETKGWTIQDVNDLMASKPEGTLFLAYTDRNSVLVECMGLAGSQFIDWDSGKCNFDSEGFIALLEFLKQFPEKVDDTMYTDEYWQNYDTMWREGRVVAQIYSAGSFSDFNYVEKGTFGEPVTLIGFPSSNGEGSAIVAGLQLAMSSKSDKKEGIWEFLRYYLTDEYQESISYGFPLSVKYMDLMGEKAKKRPTYTDENGREVETDDYIYLNGVEIKIDPMTQEEVESFKEDLYSFTQVYNYDESLIQIIQEETAAFFTGQKSAEDVAHIVQSRAQIYVNENR